LSSCCPEQARTLARLARYVPAGPAAWPILALICLQLSGCGDPAAVPSKSPSDCLGATTAIAEIQGDGYRSTVVGSEVRVRGIVTAVDSRGGFYIEDGNAGGTGRSAALYVDSPRYNPDTGQDVVLSGRVAERGEERDTMTSLIGVESGAVCAEDQPLPVTSVQLPLDNREREALEGMRVSLPQALSVGDVYVQYRGEVTLVADEPQFIPTEIVLPGPETTAMRQRNIKRSVTARLPPETDPLPRTSQLTSVVGVLGHDGNHQVLLLEKTLATPAAPTPTGARARGHLRIVSSNLLNFFNGDGRGSGFPGERGARSAEEYAQQRERIAAGFAQLAPDLLGVQELENDGFGPDSAAADLLDLLNAAGEGPYDVIKLPSGRVGADVISVGLFYRKEALQAVGPPEVLEGPAFDGLSRPPLAQLFRDPMSGAKLLVAVNHLKSKYGCPDSGVNADQGDGQGCWNAARVAAVKAEVDWLRGLAQKGGTDRILILGDMNAYRLEDPIRAFNAAGFVDVVEAESGLPQWSYVYRGQAGTLDYAFASPALARLAARAENWHINSDWPRNMNLPRPWLRMSDHDPVVVDLDFSQSPTSD
jgi:predicted extracellular nuclease